VLEDPGELASYTTAPAALMSELVRFFQRSGGTTLALFRVDADRPVEHDAPSMELASGVFRLNVANRGERTFEFQRPPAATFRTDPFGYTLRKCAVFAED
jgi:hypothetical protein